MKYEITDPATTRAREFLARVLVCAWRGHDRPSTFKGGLKSCTRCGR